MDNKFYFQNNFLAIVNLDGIEEESKDKAINHEIEKYKALAIEKGVIKGYGNDEYGWDDPVTREQLITILGRLGLI